jgi:Nucleotide modification associated domain 3
MLKSPRSLKRRMSKIYLVNVGANTAHRSAARCPIFDNGRFVFVSFPKYKPDFDSRPYPEEARPFIRDVLHTHLDPDWENYTYGDFCHNPRAMALQHVHEDDTLLFWSLLWTNKGEGWTGFTGKRGWFLIGALRVRKILEPGHRPSNALPSQISRARKNVHFRNGKLDDNHYVFIGCTKHSRRFPKAVDLGVTQEDGLLYKSVRSGQGQVLRLGKKPRWNSSLRSCREVWNLDIPEERSRAEMVRDAIEYQTGYDMLRGL